MNYVKLNSIVINSAYPRVGQPDGKRHNCQINLHSTELVEIKDVVFTKESCEGRYNGIEICLDDKIPARLINIDGVRFEGSLLNNGILIFGAQDNAVINIRNCKFGKCSNPLRFSNGTNSKNVTINIIDCECEAWDSDPVWAGLMIFEDYTSKSAEAEKENNLFAPNKVKVNLTNFKLNGKKINPVQDISTICGTGADQIFYIWNDNEGSVAYDEVRYPKIVIK